MTNQSRFEQAQSETGGEWYRSPLVLLAGLVVFAGALAAIVVGVTSGSDSGQAGDGVAASTPTPHVVSEAVTGPSFGGADVPEVDAVTVSGEALAPFSTPAEDESIGASAPVITATSLANGASVTLGTGKARVIGFFAHWCPHCQQELPQLTSWLNDTKLPPDTQFVAVSTAVAPERGNYPPSAWFDAESWPAPVVVDDEQSTLLSTFGFNGFPAFVAIDANGVVVGRAGGNVGPAGVASLFALFASDEASASSSG